MFILEGPSHVFWVWGVTSDTTCVCLVCTDKLHPYCNVIASDQIASIEWKRFETLSLAPAWTQEEMGFDIYSLSALSPVTCYESLPGRLGTRYFYNNIVRVHTQKRMPNRRWRGVDSWNYITVLLWCVCVLFLSSAQSLLFVFIHMSVY